MPSVKILTGRTEEGELGGPRFPPAGLPPARSHEAAPSTLSRRSSDCSLPSSLWPESGPSSTYHSTPCGAPPPAHSHLVSSPFLKASLVTPVWSHLFPAGSLTHQIPRGGQVRRSGSICGLSNEEDLVFLAVLVRTVPGEP